MEVKNLLERQKLNQKTAIKSENIELSYCDWHDLATKWSDVIKNTVKGINVGVFLPNSIEYAIAYFSILYANKIIVPINAQAKNREIKFTMLYCELDMIISNSASIEIFKELENDYKFRFCVFYIDTSKFVIYNQEKDVIRKTENVNDDLWNAEEKVVLMLHTSGTTSNPKRVMLTNRNLISNVESNISSLNVCDLDIVYIALPMCFGYCNTAQFLTHIYVGGSMYINKGPFTVHDFFKVVEEKKITNFTAVPTMLIMLLKYKYSDRYNLSSLKYICFGGGAISKECLKKIITKYKDINFVHTYGQTECSPRLTCLIGKYDYSKIGSVGKAIPGVVIKIVNGKDVVDSPFIEGEIMAKGKNVMKGYYKHPQITKETIEDGWIHTGDLGYYDEDGYLYISGRKKNLIISGGINIYPEEIEETLREYEGIEDAYVYGIHNDILGEVPVAKIISKVTLPLEELNEYCKIKRK